LRAQLARALPDAEEVIAYKMPGFRIRQSIIAGYAAFSKQCGLYLSPSAIKSHADDIAAAGLKSTKTGVTFSPSQPIPDGLESCRNDRTKAVVGLSNTINIGSRQHCGR